MYYLKDVKDCSCIIFTLRPHIYDIDTKILVVSRQIQATQAVYSHFQFMLSMRRHTPATPKTSIIVSLVKYKALHWLVAPGLTLGDLYTRRTERGNFTHNQSMDLKRPCPMGYYPPKSTFLGDPDNVNPGINMRRFISVDLYIIIKPYLLL